MIKGERRLIRSIIASPSIRLDDCSETPISSMLIYASAVSSSAVCEVFLGVKWLDRKRAECHLNPVTQVRFLPRPLILNYIIMPNMSYCRFENTAKDMRDCIYAIEDRDVYDFGDYELRGFKEVFELAQEIVNMEDDIEKIIEYYED